MPVYYVKLLELQAIKKVSDKYYLQVRLSFEKDHEIYLEIDEFTAENLMAVIQCDGKYKYRLSFNSSLDITQQQHVSLLTQTYLEHSNKISFLCSEDYTNILTTIKNIQHINDLDNLAFVYKSLEPIDEEHKKQELTEDITAKKYIHKFPRISIAVLSAMFLISFGYLSNIYLNRTVVNDKVLAQSIQLNNDVDTEHIEKLYSTNNIVVQNVSTDQINIPFIELDETITYSIEDGTVALTFDDGPSQYSMEIVDVLKKYEVGGTFFFIGQNVKKYPEHIKYVQSNGYSIGSHSLNHIDMPTTSYANQEKELVQSIELLEEITNEEVTLFRPPYGSFNKHIKDLIHENQYKMVLWNNDPEDWKTRDADKIFDDIQNSQISGSIILLHESQAVVDALPRIIEYLQQLDLKIVNLR